MFQCSNHCWCDREYKVKFSLVEFSHPSDFTGMGIFFNGLNSGKEAEKVRKSGWKKVNMRKKCERKKQTKENGIFRQDEKDYWKIGVSFLRFLLRHTFFFSSFIFISRVWLSLTACGHRFFCPFPNNVSVWNLPSKTRLFPFHRFLTTFLVYYDYYHYNDCCYYFLSRSYTMHWFYSYLKLQNSSIFLLEI